MKTLVTNERLKSMNFNLSNNSKKIHRQRKQSREKPAKASRTTYRSALIGAKVRETLLVRGASPRKYACTRLLTLILVCFADFYLVRGLSIGCLLFCLMRYRDMTCSLFM